MLKKVTAMICNYFFCCRNNSNLEGMCVFMEKYTKYVTDI